MVLFWLQSYAVLLKYVIRFSYIYEQSVFLWLFTVNQMPTTYEHKSNVVFIFSFSSSFLLTGTSYPLSFVLPSS